LRSFFDVWEIAQFGRRRFAMFGNLYGSDRREKGLSAPAFCINNTIIQLIFMQKIEVVANILTVK